MDSIAPHPSALPPMPAVARILAQYSRPKLEAFITVAIGLLDVMDGDPDAEGDPLNEDEPAFDDLSRSIIAKHADGPGDSISDPGGGNVDDGLERDLADEGEPDHNGI